MEDKDIEEQAERVFKKIDKFFNWSFLIFFIIILIALIFAVISFLDLQETFNSLKNIKLAKP